tara:strand:+ start:3912 stop:4049 length:138 start_codon:yes stop_codon:yes gene_type:complete
MKTWRQLYLRQSQLIKDQLFIDTLAADSTAVIANISLNIGCEHRY